MDDEKVPSVPMPYQPQTLVASVFRTLCPIHIVNIRIHMSPLRGFPGCTRCTYSNAFDVSLLSLDGT